MKFNSLAEHITNKNTGLEKMYKINGNNLFDRNIEVDSKY